MIEVPSASQPQQVLCLPKVLDMRAARSFKSMLEEPLKSGGDWRIDASGVERVSTGCIQILAAFFAAMRSSGGSVRLSEPSRALSSAITDLGLDELSSGWKMET